MFVFCCDNVELGSEIVLVSQRSETNSRWIDVAVIRLDAWSNAQSAELFWLYNSMHDQSSLSKFIDRTINIEYSYYTFLGSRYQIPIKVVQRKKQKSHDSVSISHDYEQCLIFHFELPVYRLIYCIKTISPEKFSRTKFFLTYTGSFDKLLKAIQRVESKIRGERRHGGKIMALTRHRRP